MLDFLQNIADALFTVFQLLVNIINGIIQFFVMLPQFTTYLQTVFAYVPSPLVVFLILGVLISVVLLIVGRN